MCVRAEFKSGREGERSPQQVLSEVGLQPPMTPAHVSGLGITGLLSPGSCWQSLSPAVMPELGATGRALALTLAC